MSLKKLAGKVKKENKSKALPLADKIAKSMDDFITSGKQYPPRKSRKAFNPSSYYKCMRQMFYKLKGIEEKRKDTPRSQRILQVGTQLHEWVQREVLMKMDGFEDEPIKIVDKKELPSFEEVDFEIVEHALDLATVRVLEGDGGEYYEIDKLYSSIPETEVKFLDYRWTKEFPISAMVDGYLEFEGEQFLFEFKTINPKDFDNLIEPLPDHVKQGAIYATSTGIKRVMFLYLCKGTQNWKPYMVEYSDEQIEWVKARIQNTEEYVLNDELPPAEVSQHCRWCSFKKLCEKDSKGNE